MELVIKFLGISQDAPTILSQSLQPTQVTLLIITEFLSFLKCDKDTHLIFAFDVLSVMLLESDPYFFIAKFTVISLPNVFQLNVLAYSLVFSWHSVIASL